MRRWREIVRPLLVGLTAGVVVLGIGGRLAMRAVAWAAGLTAGFSFGGSLEVLVAGAWRGALGGMLYLLVRRIVPEKGYARGWALGALLFVLSAATLPESLRAIASELDAVVLTLSLFGALFLVYGIAVEWSMRRRSARDRLL